MKTLAGWQFHHRNPVVAPANDARNTAEAPTAEPKDVTDPYKDDGGQS
jgi:hypothetical protein